MRIYTKTGDKGNTTLIGGQRVSKSHERLDAYGSIDELNSWIGLIADQNISEEHQILLYFIQNKLFIIGSLLASSSKEVTETLPHLTEGDILMLERSIDKMSEKLPKLQTFVLPGGNIISSYCQISRTVCRRAERCILKIEGHQTQEHVLAFVNRLSDYLFVLARTSIVEFGGEERYWK